MNIRRILELVLDDSGQDLVEYAIVSAVMAAGSAVFFFVMLAIMGGAYRLWVNQILAIAEPNAPCGCP